MEALLRALQQQRATAAQDQDYQQQANQGQADQQQANQSQANNADIQNPDWFQQRMNRSTQ